MFAVRTGGGLGALAHATAKGGLSPATKALRSMGPLGVQSRPGAMATVCDSPHVFLLSARNRNNGL